MAASEYIKTITVADTVVQELAGRSVIVTKSTVSQLQGDDIELHRSIAQTVVSENDTLMYQSIVGGVRGRIIKTNKSAIFYTKADVLESKNSFSFITNAETIQGTMYTVFTKTTAAIFASILLLGYHLLRKHSR